MIAPPFRAATPGGTSSSPPPERVITRLWSRYREDGKGCWVSGYSTGSHGYAQIGWTDQGERRLWLAHRIAWFASNGPIPDGLTVDHLCRERKCINPAHLRLLSNWDNARRNGWSELEDYPLEWTCPRNHGKPRRESNGQCPDCQRDTNIRYRARKKAQER